MEQHVKPSGVPVSPTTAQQRIVPPSVNTESGTAKPFFVRRPLEPVPTWARYDAELEQLCRVAAAIGAADSAAQNDPEPRPPLSYTALIIAFLWGSDPVSEWFRQYTGKRSINVAEIFKSKNTLAAKQEQFVSQARSGALPSTRPLYSTSAIRILRAAADIARVVRDDSGSTVVVGARHVMAAYAFRTPVDHRDQLSGWRFDEADWRQAFLTFAKEEFPDDHWSRLNDEPQPITENAVSSFTSDDPLAAAVDLLNVDDEAAAFARVAAAKAISPPLAIGIFGEWGSGKTFFMRRIYENVNQLTNCDEDDDYLVPFHKDIVQIRFNAWHYIETNLWASLVEYIFTELDRWLTQHQPDGQSRSDLVFDRLATAQQLKLDALEEVAARRAERRNAEQRAERARRDYEHALARSTAVGGKTYARAFLQALLSRGDVKADLTALGDRLGAPKLSEDAGRLVDVLEQARSEAGRARLMMRSGTARMGRVPWMLGVAGALIFVPLAATALKDGVASLLGSSYIASIHDTVIAISGLLAVLATTGGMLVRQASSALEKVDEFDQKLRAEIDAQRQTVDPTTAVIAEDELRKRRQELDVAERALADADVRLISARQDFENATARSRLNAFIRAKATEGDYAKYLGIVAAIRRDFGQLATLMGSANEAEEQARERDRLATDAAARVARFLDWLRKEPEVRLTRGEVRSVLMLLDPAHAHALLSTNNGENDTLLRDRLEGGSPEFDAIMREVQVVQGAPLPRFSRIILYIDDLDRCPTDIVVKVLQAVHLLLSFPLFTVIVAVDSRWVSRALREEFPQLLAETRVFSGNGSTPGAGATSHDYLEKIFQIPYWVRAIDRGSAETYVGNLVKQDVQIDEVAKPQPSPVAITVNGGGAAATNAPGTNAAPGAASGTTMVSAPQTAAQQLQIRRAQAASLELTQWEADALQRFAPLVGGTPRRLIRFVNVYRLIKTSLSPMLLRDFVGRHGESASYRGLVAQLAIVTGAPEACQRYFTVIEALAKEKTVSDALEELESDGEFNNAADCATVRDILASARDLTYGSELTIGQLRSMAPIARRYSFIARPQ